STIAWQDHVGGLVVGLLLTAAFAYAPRKNRALIQVAAAAVILAVLVVLVVFRNHDLASQIGF
ncbi:MAG: rhomboid family intramembrane serine protease, partial [Trebonia sp.]